MDTCYDCSVFRNCEDLFYLTVADTLMTGEINILREFEVCISILSLSMRKVKLEEMPFLLSVFLS